MIIGVVCSLMTETKSSYMSPKCLKIASETIRVSNYHNY